MYGINLPKKGTRTMEYILTVAVLFLCVLLHIGETYNLSDADNLLKDKLSTYNKKLRPVYNQSNTINVSVGFELISIQGLDEVQGKLSTLGFLNMFWIDEQMTWNDTEHGGIHQLTIESGDFWTPNLILTNPFEQFVKLSNDWTIIRFVNRQGHVYFSPGQQFVSSCEVDIELYPWDTQTCNLQFTAYGYSSNEVRLQLKNDKVQMSYFSPNGMWDIVNTSADIYTTEFSTTAVFGVRLKRKPQFIVVNVILPIVIMSFLSIVVFLIPAESGERISYCLTVLLSIVVFLTLIGDSLPKTPSPMPILSWYLLTVLCISVLVTLCTVFSLMMYFRDENKSVPYVLSRVIRSLHCNYRYKNQVATVESIQQLDDDQYKENATKLTKNTVSIKNETVNGKNGLFQNDYIEDVEIEPQRKEITWKDVSFAFDKFCCVSFTLVLIISTLVFGIKASGSE